MNWTGSHNPMIIILPQITIFRLLILIEHLKSSCVWLDEASRAYAKNICIFKKRKNIGLRV